MLNSLRPSDAIWRQGHLSTLLQVMACCLTASSHYLNQCGLIISEVLWHSPEGNFTLHAKAAILMSLKVIPFWIAATSPKVNELTQCNSGCPNMVSYVGIIIGDQQSSVANMRYLRHGKAIASDRYMWDVIIHPCHNVRSGLNKLLLLLGQVWIIMSPIVICQCYYLFIPQTQCSLR